MRSNSPICTKIKGPVLPFTVTGIQGAFSVAHRPEIVSARWEGWLCPDSTSPSFLCFHICDTAVENIHCKSIRRKKKKKDIRNNFLHLHTQVSLKEAPQKVLILRKLVYEKKDS